ncbi:potassium channel family protein [Kitasatospora mediocidica]|uniref:potassium channel family protein n=1 Tax=Kitasatospora mediocidica TaxID=58352 RepID=UPI00068E5BED|nr:potassium channel family protein [Kitasatospora mediocidica]
MAQTQLDDLPAPPRRRLLVVATLRTTVRITLVTAVYFLIPMDRTVNAATVTGLVLGILVLVVVVAWQLRGIMRAKRPGIQAIEALALTVPLFVLLFATVYFLMSHTQATTFSEPLSRVGAMYFSATVFTTVGFGDITAKSDAARIIVTTQMMLDLLALGVVVRLVLNAVNIGRHRHAT